MKKADVLILCGTLLFSALVYDQFPGINFTIFTLLLTAGLLAIHPQKSKDVEWWSFALLANLAGLSVFTVSNPFTVLAALASWFVLAGKTVASRRTVLAAGLSSALSVARSPYDIVLQGTGYLGKGETKNHNRRAAIAVTIALVAAVPFLLLYRASNPLFDQFVSAIDMSFIDPGWFLFTVFSLFLVFGLLRTQTFPMFESREDEMMQDVLPVPINKAASGGLSVLGISLFGILNLMLLLMNGLDIRQIYVAGELPEGITLSEFVHEAVTAMIVSVAFAVIFIMFLFRGEVNFSRGGRILRLLVFLWMAQTVLVIINTMVRNNWYIQEYQLTHLRIGVFIFLFITLAGLALTWYKVSSHKSAWWLVTANVRLWFTLFILLSAIHWNRFITSYNIGRAAGTGKLDREFLLRMGESNLPQLVELHKTHPFTGEELQKLRKRVEWELKEINEVQPFGNGWPSYSLRFERNNKAIEEFTELDSGR